ncbi:hypothetical protein VNI00_002785 [Paramarasmius palmivorus]|uniref:Uncharacterized protein n=1 Tax=Paramarasmius palmivorus TaxID=297713 RepID=A0AAW0DYN9_9AGAR
MSDALNQLNVSLETHLVDTLRQLHPVLPSHHQAQLTPYLSSQRPDKIPSTSGSQAFLHHSPKLNPRGYTMIALLAGATTSPERQFAPYEPPKEPEQLAQEKKKERKAIAAIINGVFSVVGTAIAAWWGSERAGWRNEWRLLFAFFAAVTVAFTETVLYIIWQSRQHSVQKSPQRYDRLKKRDSPEPIGDTQQEVLEEKTQDGLRQRRAPPSGKYS